ncbi:MAG: DinB family protein [Bacteroidetes bacterium]|nr:DinB family protein [Bacteroidota bacterium]
MISAPKPGEYQPYFEQYIKEVSDDADILAWLEDIIMDTEEIILALPKSKHEYRYAEGKWTIKEILQHLIDTERIMCYRAMCIARGDQASLPGFEEDDYAAKSFANKRTVDALLDEFDMVRNCTIALFKSFDTSVLETIGTANGKQISVRALAYIIAGHELHHMKVIQERYV